MGNVVKNKDTKLEEKDILKSSIKEIEHESKKGSQPKNNKKIILLIVILILFIILFIGLHLMRPKITLNGKDKIEIAYKEEYNEQGAKASLFGKDLTSKIKITGKVNNKKLGDYEIIYTVKDGFFRNKKKRIVSVIDKNKPEITLEGEKDLIICPNSEYKELGYKAIDDYDGDITDKVKIDKQDNKINYSVSDTYGNKTTITRNITKSDKEKPEITLNGGNTVQVVLNGSYNDSGYKAIDNCSGDLTDKVKKEGSVDTTKEGTYEIKYTVSDDYGNEATQVRKVIVQRYYPKASGNLSCGEAGVIYLTFDDGPHQYNTPKVLDTLKKYNVKATFFITNKSSDQLVKREFDEGHVVAIHTASHDYGTIYKSSEAFWNDINLVSKRIERITGQKSYLLRFPGGSSNTISRRYSSGIMSKLTYEAKEKGYAYFDWNLMSGDADTALQKAGSDAQYRQVVNNLSKSRGNVVLMHDIQPSTADSVLKRVIEYGINNGYTFKVLDSSITCHQKVNN